MPQVRRGCHKDNEEWVVVGCLVVVVRESSSQDNLSETLEQAGVSFQPTSVQILQAGLMSQGRDQWEARPRQGLVKRREQGDAKRRDKLHVRAHGTTKYCAETLKKTQVARKHTELHRNRLR